MSFKNAGFSFVETLVGLVLMSLLMLVMNLSHFIAIREATYSYYYIYALMRLNYLQPAWLI